MYAIRSYYDPSRADMLVAAFQAGLEQVAEIDDAETPRGDRAGRWEGRVPDAVRHLGRGDDGVASLPRFWDQLGVLYRDGRTERLTPDPFLATGSMPPLSSTFSDMSVARRTLPVFDPILCTGCGKCCVITSYSIHYTKLYECDRQAQRRRRSDSLVR